MEDTFFDFIIIGAGSTGLTAADFAAKLETKVLLVEANKIGGECTWTGCIPSKALLHCSSVIKDFTAGQKFGWVTGKVDVDFSAIKSFVQRAINDIAITETPEILRKEGIDVKLGKAQFKSPITIEVNGGKVSGKKILICTGAKPIIPPIEGLENVPFHTYETIFDIENLPAHLMIIGDGPISCEIGQAFQTFGSKVTIIEELDRLIPNDDPDASKLLAEILREDGIDLHFGNRVNKLSYSDQSREITVSTKKTNITGDTLLVVVGREPNVKDLNLEAANISLNEQGGISVNKNLRTSQKNIFAAGDCIGGLQFTHLGGYQGFMAARNALLPGNTLGMPKYVPWTTFTNPEVAHVGISSPQEYKTPEKVETCIWPLSKVDRAVTDSKTKGFLKFYYKKNGTILGVTIVAPHAGDMIQEWIFTMIHGKKLGDIANTIHVYPTYSIGSMRVATSVRMNQAFSGISGKFLKKFS